MLGYSTPLRNAKLDALTTYVGGGAKLRIYSGVRPANGAALSGNTLLGEFTCATPFAPAAAAGVLSPTLPANVNAAATGTATWFRLVNADGVTHCADGGVATSGAELNLTTTSITTGLQLAVTSWTVTAGNVG